VASASGGVVVIVPGGGGAGFCGDAKSVSRGR
jgi:hypothetical protein